jgi:hypothetical protein
MSQGACAAVMCLSIANIEIDETAIKTLCEKIRTKDIFEKHQGFLCRYKFWKSLRKWNLGQLLFTCITINKIKELKIENTDPVQVTPFNSKNLCRV